MMSALTTADIQNMEQRLLDGLNHYDYEWTPCPHNALELAGGIADACDLRVIRPWVNGRVYFASKVALSAADARAKFSTLLRMLSAAESQ
jgi:hypothetical protein